MQGEQLDSAPLYLAATRPAMIPWLGVPYSAGVVLIMAAGLIVIFGHNPVYLHLVAWIGGMDALSTTRVPGHAMRTYSGRPSSSIRFSTSAAIATSIICRPSVWKRRPPPTTHFQREMSDSPRARQLYPEARCQPMR